MFYTGENMLVGKTIFDQAKKMLTNSPGSLMNGGEFSRDGHFLRADYIDPGVHLGKGCMPPHVTIRSVRAFNHTTEFLATF